MSSHLQLTSNSAVMHFAFSSSGVMVFGSGSKCTARLVVHCNSSKNALTRFYCFGFGCNFCYFRGELGGWKLDCACGLSI